MDFKTYPLADREALADIAVALERFDAAFGRPFNPPALRIRILSWLPAMRGLPRSARTWATDIALRTLEEYPTPAQLRRLAQASPAYRAEEATRRPSAPTTATPEESSCLSCREPRAEHRVQAYAGAPRPLVLRTIRHQEDCFYGTHEIAWFDPPAYGRLQEGDQAWSVLGIDWAAPPRRGEAPAAKPGQPSLEDLTDEERQDRAAGYRAAAEEARTDT